MRRKTEIVSRTRYLLLRFSTGFVVCMKNNGIFFSPDISQKVFRDKNREGK